MASRLIFISVDKGVSATRKLAERSARLSRGTLELAYHFQEV